MTVAPSVRSAAPRRARWVVRWGLTLIFVWVLVQQVDLASAGTLIFHADASLLAAAVVLLTLDRIFQGAKWYPLVRAQTAEFGFWRCVRASMAAYPAALLLPGVGADVLRAVGLGRATKVVPELSASIVMERYLGLLALVLANLLAVLAALEVSEHMHKLLPSAVFLAVAGVGALGIALSRPVRVRIRAWARRRGASGWTRPVARFGRAFSDYRDYPGTVFAVLLLSLVETGLIVLVMWVLALALGTSITLRMVLVAAPVTLLLYRLPVTVWGLGLADGGFGALLNLLYSVPLTEAVSVTLAFRATEVCVAAPALMLWRDLLGHRG